MVKKCCRGRWEDGKCLCPTSSCYWNNHGCKKCILENDEPKYIADSSQDGKTCGSCKACSSGMCADKIGGIYRGNRTGEELCCDCAQCGNSLCAWCPLDKPASACSDFFPYKDVKW